uniref:1-phosphatidylinositol 4,5-bisphosphate phosphodiesterase n=1 Tax=Neogonodactylus oerstedii TaxID=85128 RepID=A0A2H4WAN2_NEOOE|nr:phospholipase C [Neogonodactylus oerstedii]
MAGAKPGVHVLQLKNIVVPPALCEGEKFVKWDEDNSQGTQVTLRVDPDGFFLYWTYWADQHETELMDMAHIRDARTNKYAKIPRDQKLREQVNIGQSDVPLEQKTLTVLYGPNFVDISTCNFVGHKPETVKLWADELLKMAYNLLAQNSSPFTFLRKAHTRLTLQTDKNGKIPVKNFIKLFARHADDKRRVEMALDQAGLPSGKNDSINRERLTWDTFLVFYNKLTTRIEVEKVFCQLTGQTFSQGKKMQRLMSVEQLVEFLNQHQRDPRLNEILYPYADAAKAKETIAMYEPNKENVAKNVLSCDGFLLYLLSDDNPVVSMEKLDLYEDMEEPLSHYFINSSHNTYLIGHQLTGRSSVEMYRQCLLSGCRCVELDFWNGRTEEPVIVHGYTLVPEISAKEVIEAIAESAFKTSEWPVVLSFENHCNPRQQAKIAQYCREFFGEHLLDSPIESHKLEPGAPLPPPSLMKRRIIIKNKKKHRAHHHKSQQQQPANPAQFHVALDNTSEPQHPTEMQGNGEIPRPPLEKEGSESYEEDMEVANAFPHLVARLIGEIPDGGGVEEDSSSSEDEDEGSVGSGDTGRPPPTDPGTASSEVEAGAEISALVNYVQPVHYHSFEISEKRNRSYEMSSFVETHALNLLKESPVEFVNYNKRQLSRVYPRGTRVDSSNFLPHQFWNAGCQLVALNYQSLDLPMQLNLGLFEYNNRSGYLLKPDFMRRPDRKFDPFAESTVDGIIAGTVSVKVISGQFLQERRAGCFAEVEMYGLPADTFRKRFKTKTVPNNCLNPVWDEEPFVFKKVVLPELACLRITACEDGSRSMLGHRVLPIVGLRPGYKHIVLRNEAGQPLNLATLFVHIKVGDYVPDGLSDFAEALANPIKYQSELEKRAQQLSVFQDDEENEEEEGTAPHTPVGKAFSDRGATIKESSGTKTSSGGDDSNTKEPTIRTRSNGEVTSTPGVTASESTPHGTRRQNSIPGKSHLSTRSSDEKTAGEKDSALESGTIEIVAESLEKLLGYKIVKEKKVELEKSLEKMKKKHEKERQNMAQLQEKKKSQLQKCHTKLVKKYSNKNMETGQMKRETDKDLTALLEEHESRLQKLEQNYRVTLQSTHLAQIEAERKLQEKYHETIYLALEKSLKTSQAAQLKALQSYHDRRVEDSKRRMEEQHREERKNLIKNTSDKEELNRKKREIGKALVAKGTNERQRLTDMYEEKRTDLEKQHEEVRKKFEEEKTRAKDEIESTFEEKKAKIEKESCGVAD